MHVISLNMPKSAKVYDRSLSSLLSTPDSLQQYSAVSAESQKCIDSNANFLFKYTIIRQSLQ